MAGCSIGLDGLWKHSIDHAEQTRVVGHSVQGRMDSAALSLRNPH